ncbi:hypothetical protein [Amycolatopsis rubida]|uniref:Uncharacterized protein n=1 Tax=Amycolatopsis rubida TaxID=112413 RepID=A0A1I5KSV3_9PSEU|nr:hypothetical protein [Amycolatopsis rubida]SFO88028.1 hypothetical protein SAMN05421854_103323 [Amycolatopsis rubida]
MSTTITGTPVTETTDGTTATTWSASYGGVTVRHSADHRLMGHALPLYALAYATPTSTRVDLRDRHDRTVASAMIGRPDPQDAMTRETADANHS